MDAAGSGRSSTRDSGDTAFSDDSRAPQPKKLVLDQIVYKWGPDKNGNDHAKAILHILPGTLCDASMSKDGHTFRIFWAPPSKFQNAEALTCHSRLQDRIHSTLVSNLQRDMDEMTEGSSRLVRRLIEVDLREAGVDFPCMVLDGIDEEEAGHAGCQLLQFGQDDRQGETLILHIDFIAKNRKPPTAYRYEEVDEDYASE